MKSNAGCLVLLVLVVAACGRATAGPLDEITVRAMSVEQWRGWHEQATRIGSHDYEGLAPQRGPVAAKGGFRPVGGIVSHHLLVGPLIESYFAELSRRAGDIDTLVLMGPDHFRRAEQGVLVAEADFVWQGRRLVTDRQTARMWQRELGLERDDYPFLFEHSITSLLPFAAEHFLAARIVAVIIHPECSFGRLDELVGLLRRRASRGKTLVLLSTDFAHHLDTQETEKRDRESLAVLQAMHTHYTRRLTCDCLKGWYVFARALRGRDPSMEIVFHTTNEQYLNAPQDDITSYFFAIVTADVAPVPDRVVFDDFERFGFAETFGGRGTAGPPSP